MSKAAKQSIFILIFLLIMSIAFTSITMLQKQNLEKTNSVLVERVKETQKIAEIEKSEAQKLRIEIENQIKKAQNEKSLLEQEIEKAKKRMEDLLEEVDKVSEDRDKWKERIDTARQERDKIMLKLEESQDGKSKLERKIRDLEEELNDKISEIKNKDKEIESVKKQIKEQKEKTAYKSPREEIEEVKYEKPPEPKIEIITEPKDNSLSLPAVNIEVQSSENEEYWASILREKAALEVEISKLQKELSENSMEMVDIKNINENLKLEIQNLMKEKEAVNLAIVNKEKELRDKEEMLNTLSIELTRSKNDNSAVKDRIAKYEQENKDLRLEMQKLVQSKSSMEKSIVRLTRDKSELEKKLGETDGLIQSKIDEIWEIKESIDKVFKESRTNIPVSKEVELPPIVVSSQGPLSSAVKNEKEERPVLGKKLNGKVVSVNETNNFIIVDIGESSGIKLGDVLNVYRDTKYLARVEVIQVRDDISAADIKDQVSSIKVGDIIR